MDRNLPGPRQTQNDSTRRPLSGSPLEEGPVYSYKIGSENPIVFAQQDGQCPTDFGGGFFGRGGKFGCEDRVKTWSWGGGCEWLGGTSVVQASTCRH
jgi:hypothetical protein